MDISEPLTTLKRLLEQRLSTSLAAHEFYLQDVIPVHLDLIIAKSGKSVLLNIDFFYQSLDAKRLCERIKNKTKGTIRSCRSFGFLVACILQINKQIIFSQSFNPCRARNSQDLRILQVAPRLYSLARSPRFSSVGAQTTPREKSRVSRPALVNIEP